MMTLIKLYKFAESTFTVRVKEQVPLLQKVAPEIDIIPLSASAPTALLTNEIVEGLEGLNVKVGF